MGTFFWKLKTIFFTGISVVLVVFFFFQNQSSLQAATSYVGVSNLIATDGSAPGAITPNASTANGDLLVFYHYARATGGNETVTLPTGFTTIFNSVTADQGLVAVGWRIKQAGDTTFTASVTNHTTGGNGESILEWIETFRGADTVSPITSYTSTLSTWASSLNLGPVLAPPTTTVANGDAVVVFAGRIENITSQTVLSGDNLTWTTQTLNDTTLGRDAGAVTQMGVNASGSNQTITAKTITTSGSAQAGAGRMFIIKKASDTTAPTPNPMTFAAVPTNDSSSQISMTATTASDPSSPVSYLFTNDNSSCGANTGTGGTTSAWQTTTAYSDIGLQTNKCYGYTVTARDAAPTPNVGTASSLSSAYTSANTPGTPTLSGATTNSLNLTNAENGNPASNPTTNFAVQVVTTTDATWLNKWVDTTGNPSTIAAWMSDAQLDALTLHNLQSNTLYGVKVKARNQDNDETALSTEGQGTTSAPAPITTISNFVTSEPSNTTIAPSASGLVDSFGLQTTSGSDTVTGATVTLASGTGTRIATVSITNNGDTLTYCSNTPSGDIATLTGCGIPVSTTNTQFKIKITAISHAAMPAPPGGSYAVTATVTAFTSTNAQTGTDSGSATVTIDNLSPASATSASGSAGSTQVVLSWTNPADSDYTSQTVLRRAGSAVADIPTEGATYSVGNTIGTATVACVETAPAETCTDAGLTNGTAYYYKLFSKDSRGNYSSATTPSGAPFTPSLTTFTIISTAGSGGTISPLGSTVVAQGSSQTYTITPNLGYDIATLTVDGSSIATSTSYTFGNIQQNHTIDVTFVLTTPTYTITSSAGANGSISPLGTTVFLQGASQTYTITPTPGYYVDTLLVDAASVATSTSYTFTNISANHTISATFALAPPPVGTFAITATAGSNGSINPSGVTIVTQGNSQSYTIAPDSGYEISTLTVDGVSVAAATSYTFTNVQTNHTIDATFALLPVSVVIPDTGASRATTIIFSGKAFPRGIVSVVDKQLNTETMFEEKTVTKDDGSFSISFIGIFQALHSFGLLAKDAEGRVSQSKFFFINTISNDLVIKELLIPPTGELESRQVTRGDNAFIEGRATPNYTTHLELDGILIQDTLVNKDGVYNFTIPTGALEFGNHTIRIKQTSPDGSAESDFSTSRTLAVSRLIVIEADMNSDGKIDIRDWSIFLSLWGSKSTSAKSRVDFNKDGKVDISDFSIFIKTIRKK